MKKLASVLTASVIALTALRPSVRQTPAAEVFGTNE